MKALFVHNIKIKKDDCGNLYTHSSYNNKVWKRYIDVFGNLSVITRNESKVYDISYAKKHFERFDKSLVNNIETINIYSSFLVYLNPLYRKKNRDTVKQAVLEHDFIIARLPSYTGYMAIDFARKYKKPYLIEVVACSWDGLWNHSLKGKVLAIGSYIKQKKYVKKAPYAVYVTNEFLQKRYPCHGYSVNCSDVVLNEFDENIIERRVNKINNLKTQDKIIIGTTAAVDVAYKGQQYIIKALGRLKDRGITNFEYQLVGDGNQSYLKHIAKKYRVDDQVKFMGSMTHSEVFKWLDKIDIYAQPSKQEGLPRALIEAMSRGLPAIGANTAGIPELLESNFIFSNTRRNIKEIIRILKLFDKETMKVQAKRNYDESKKYEKNIIEDRRKKFFKKFKNYGSSTYKL